MESLLVATDFSPDAANAARRAALLGAALGARHARLLHVAPQLPLAAELELKANRAIEQLLDENIDALRRESGFGFAPQLATGAVVDEICRAARADDLIVVGAHGLHPLRDFAIGTTAERLLRKSARPVLVVKRPPAGAYRSVLVPVDFSPDSAAALEVAQRVAAAAELHLAHAFEVGIEGKLRFAGVPDEEIHRYRREAREQARSEMENTIARHQGHALISRIIAHGYPPSVISEAEKEVGADLVVIGKHGRSRIEELLLGSVTLHVLATAQCDVLVVHGTA